MLNYFRSLNVEPTKNHSCLFISAVFSSSKIQTDTKGGKPGKFRTPLLKKLKYIKQKYEVPDLEKIIREIPRKIWQRKSDFGITYSFTIHRKVADFIASAVLDSAQKQEKWPLVIELNPGIGLITKALLEKGVQNLVIYNPFIFSSFKTITHSYSKRIKVHQMNGLETRHNQGKNMYLNFFQDMLKAEGERLIIIGVSPNRLFYRRLIYFTIHVCWNFFENTEMYVTIPSKIYGCLTSADEPQARVMDYGSFNTLFKIDILHEFPRDAFLPLAVGYNEKVYFAKVSRGNAILSQEDALLFMNFLRAIGSRKSNYVIGMLEKWFPGSGPYFIAHGISVTNQAHEFKVQELLKLFKIAQGLKGYDDSFLMLKNYESDNTFSDNVLSDLEPVD